ncbi:MAG: PAS domain S-box protein [Leptospiraceae bacterium]|nr:PAS domain S-box protein [Leptospiraceae bacterium]MCP5511439.1 PAS domain S-box protein [Leptospiraceae bacterium]
MWKNSIGKKLGLGFAGIILLFSLKTVYTIHSLGELFKFTELIYEYPFTVSNTVLKIKADLGKIHQTMRNLSFQTEWKDTKNQLELLQKYDSSTLTNLETIQKQFSGDQKLVTMALDSFHAWKKNRDTLLNEKDFPSWKSHPVFSRTDLISHTSEIEESLDQILKFSEQKAMNAHKEAKEKTIETIQTAYSILFGIILFSTLLGVHFIRTITNPIVRLKDLAREISEGNLEVRVETDQRDEIGDLADSFSKMSASLKSMIEYEKLRVRDSLENSEKYRRLVEGLPGIIYIFSDKRGGVYYSNFVETVLGYSIDYFYNHPFLWQESIHLEDKIKISETLKNLDRKETFEIEYRIKTKSGEWKWILDRSIYTKITEEEVLIEGLAMDISERKYAENKIKELNLDFLSFLNNTTDFVYFKDKNSRFRFCSQTLADITGHSSWQEMIGKHDLEVFPEETAEIYYKEELPIFREGKPLLNKEDPYFDESGSKKWVSTNKWPLKDSEGNVVGLFGISRDITEQKNIQSELEKAKNKAEAANKAKTEFLATMSHEIRTPMNAILGFTELLEKLITDPRQKSYIDAVQSGSQTLLRLINDILDLAKIESGKITMQYESLNFYKFLEDVIDIFEMKIKQKKLKKILEIEPTLPSFLIFDELRLRQILFNLLGNAIKFTETGYIKLSAFSIQNTYDGNYIDISIIVEDTGIGIPPEEQERVFDAFHKFEPIGLRKYEGTGLGLSISKRLSEVMGGELHLESKEGKGSKFTLILHGVEIISSTDILKKTESDMIPDISNLEGKIMIVDDIASNRNLIRESFEGSKITIIEAENGLEAIEKIKLERPNLILMDLKMPIMDGFEACHKIKSNPIFKSIPIVAITASSLETYERLHHFNGYLRKPVSLNDLFREINRHMLEFEDSNQDINKETGSGEIQNVPDIDRLLLDLNNKYLPRLEAFKKRQPMKEVRQFGLDLIDLGNEFVTKELTSYGQSIVAYIERFDVENVRKILWTFPDLIQRYEKYKSIGNNNESG